MSGFLAALTEHAQLVAALESMAEDVEVVAEQMASVIESGGKIFWMGNGGSAADAQHYAAELMVRYTRNRKPIPSIALTTDTSLITAHSNDFEYETLFERQVEALCCPNDLCVGISTSGNSKNVFLAMKKASELGCKTVGMLGKDGGVIAGVVSHRLVVPSSVTARIQEAHLLIGHYLCDHIESQFV